MTIIEYGTRIIGAPLEDGPSMRLAVHRFSGRDKYGLAVTACGLYQERRSNDWILYRPENPQHREIPTCPECLPEEEP